MNRLQYTFEAGTDVPYLSDAPVWPVSSDAELAALHATVAVFGAHLEQVEPDSHRRAGDPVVNGEESIVAYLDTELRELAQLYGHLTRRKAHWVPLDRLEGCMPEMVICLWKHLTLEAVGQIHRLCLKRPAGVLTALTPGELRGRILRSAAAALLEPPSAGRMVVVLGAHSESIGPGLADNIDTAVLLHIGHGDGLDIKLTSEEVLCDVRWRTDQGRALGPAPPCVLRDHCYRLELPLATALRNTRLLAPSDLRARAAIFLTCFGVSASDSLVPPSWSVLEGLLRTSSLGCVAVPVGISMPTEIDTIAIGWALRDGYTIGEALFENRDLTPGAHQRCQILLFGDPRLRPMRANRPRGRSASAGAILSPTARCGDSAASQPASWKDASRMAFLRDLLKIAKATTPPVAERIGGLDMQSASDAEIVECLERLAPLWDHWVSGCEPMTPISHQASCLSCQMKGQTFLARWRGDQSARLLSVCNRCGIFQDIEEMSQLESHRPSVRQGTLVIPDDMSEAWVMIRHKDDVRRSRCWVLPPGTNRREAIVPGGGRVALAEGLETLNVVYVYKAELAGWQFAFKAKPLDEM
jgi:hypothetical protein